MSEKFQKTLTKYSFQYVTFYEHWRFIPLLNFIVEWEKIIKIRTQIPIFTYFNLHEVL